MRWLASAVCVLAVSQLVCCGPAPRDGSLQRSLPQQDVLLDALPLEESSPQDAQRDKRTLGLIRQYFPGLARQNPEENQLSGAESRVYESRVAPPSGFFDLQPAASNDDAQVAASEDDAVAEGSEDGDESRSKRLINFAGGSGSGGSGGGSGNFIFDILRRTADSAARAAGTVYRLVAGTEPLGLGLGVGVATASRTTSTRSRANQTTTMQTNSTSSRALITGSSNTETTDDASAGAQASAGGGTADAAVEKDDGYQAGIPGPVTRLFILTNRGIANLVQDLILRLAQTSERIVNFKARLITAII